MSNQSVSLTVINGKGVLETLSLGSTNPQRIHAVSNARYLIANTDGGAAVQNVNFKRVGRELHITLEGSDPDQPQVIIEGFYDHPGEVVGMASDGEVYPYTAVSGDPDEIAVLLQDGVSSPQTLGREPLSGFMADLQGTDGFFWKEILSGLGAAAALAWLLHDKGGSKTAPPPQTPSLESVHSDSDSDPHVVERGGLTADNTPVLSGGGVPGGQVEIFKGSESLGVVPVNAEGQWRFTPPLALADGQHVFSVVAIDTNGQRSAASATYEIEIDATPPEQPRIAAAVDSKGTAVGEVADGLQTNDITPTLSGSAEPGSLLTIYNGGEILGSVRVDANGHWLFTVPEQAEGEQRFTVTASDAAGNTSIASDAYVVSIDITPPSVLIQQVADNAGAMNDPLSNPGRTDDSTPTISGIAEAKALVTVYDNGTAIGSVAADTQGNWSFTVPERADGRHEFTVTATDDAGNTSPISAPWAVEIDTSLPVASITQVTDDAGTMTDPITNGGRTDDNTPTLHGTATSNALVTVHDGKSVIGSVFADAKGLWSFPVPTSAHGTHTFSVTATNDVGTTGQVSEAWVVEIDTSLPVANITSVTDDAGTMTDPITNGGRTDDATPTLIGSATSNALVTIHDGKSVIGNVYADAKGVWSFPVPSSVDGTHSFSVTATNDVGTTGPASEAWVVEIDTALPVASITSVSDDAGTVAESIANGGRTDDATPTLRGTATSNALVTIHDGKSVMDSVYADAKGVWSFPVPSSADGTHSFSVTATNDVGTTGRASAAWVVEIDTSLPVASITQVTDEAGTITGPITSGGRTDDTMPTLSGTATSNALVTVHDGKSVIGSVYADANGVWSFPVPTSADGTHSFSVTATNDVGTTGPVSEVWQIVIDTSVPFASITQVTDNAGTITDPITNGGRTDDNTPTLYGIATSNALVTVHDGKSVIGSVYADAKGVWSFPVPTSADGTHSFSVTATNVVGTRGPASAAWVIEIDTSLPVASITQVNDDAGTMTGPITNGGRSDDNTPTLRGTATSNALVTIYDGKSVIGSVYADAKGVWSFPVPTSADGTHTFSVTATNDVGTTGPASAVWVVEIDTSLPVASITSVTDDAGTMTGPIANGGRTDDTTPTLRGTATSNALVTIHDGKSVIDSVYADAKGAWSFPVPTSADGTHSFSVTATNDVGTTGPASEAWVVEIDTGVPGVPKILSVYDDAGGLTGNVPRSGITDDSTPTVKGTADPGSVIKVYDGSVVLGTAMTDASGAWTLVLPELLPGSHDLTAVTRNDVGISGGASSGLDFKVGTTWDFNDKTLQGWKLAGRYGTDTTSTSITDDGHGGHLIAALTQNGGDWGGTVMSIKVQVEAGVSYQFMFKTGQQLISNEVTASLGLMVDGVATGAEVKATAGSHQFVGSYTATSTGTVTLSIHNTEHSGTGNDFWLDDLAMARVDATGPATPGVTVFNVLQEQSSLLEASELILNSSDIGKNDLSLARTDVLAPGENELFVDVEFGAQQMLVKGQAADLLDLGAFVGSGDDGEWVDLGAVNVAGIAYSSYQQSTLHSDSLLQEVGMTHVV
ncbi:MULTISPECIES: Ig-like domain-containing protein [Pseudomonas]|uniref:Ig-like domain-containing protein n=1 Tax=Pseudomonas TaxID=286 RepID=UPI0005A73A73|nr:MULTISPECIES: Ig-like domain-containing protein [Pseudomonas]AZD92639.1 T1SS secreted agglutinin RTX [Pseudomonas chlororaphis subsp. aureofaciens]AZE23669.1 T1SS secreted agglutinin RTX [Pseudomonas chlororaphis subsp. aureofaciens]KAB0532279.1 hypothetical protein F7R16_13165 [Pseudomonas chlororaphis subsp. aureofaciens]PWY37462.1 hypothetical protein DK261_21510 [Pseudomonas sp. RW409]TSD25642.1 hypothetical protein FCE86_029645 [Pseudomonas sp. ATCC 13985]